jgi:hypothetical protein
MDMDPMTNYSLVSWKCPDCGERWTDTDPSVCPYCDSHACVPASSDWQDDEPEVGSMSDEILNIDVPRVSATKAVELVAYYLSLASSLHDVIEISRAIR